MNARTYAQWVQLGCPLTVAPDGHRAYAPSGSVAWLGALDHGLAMVADKPWNAPTPPGEMQEINLTAERIDHVTLDFSECADSIDAGLVAELLKPADSEAGARSREYWKDRLRVAAQACVDTLPAEFEPDLLFADTQPNARVDTMGCRSERGARGRKRGWHGIVDGQPLTWPGLA